jgi:hypothetical protein
VIVDCCVERIGAELHVCAREIAALPWLYT